MSEVNTDPRSYAPEQRYALSGKIMLSAIVILFTVVVFIICLHIYARWFLARSRRRQQQLHRSRRRRAHIIFTSDIPSFSHGLDASLLKSLPTFVFSSNTHEDLIECAVCLSEFEENEKGRLLPKCNHSFHTACIDMWFHSHSTCPLCRSPVDSAEISEPKTTESNQIEIVVQVENSNSESNHESSYGKEEHEMGCSSSSTNPSNLTLGSRRKGFEIMGVSIEVPRRNESFKNLEDEIQKSPGGRMLSIKRMLSRASRPSTPLSCTSYPAFEIDLESGGEEEVVVQHQAATPRNQTATTTSESLRVGGT